MKSPPASTPADPFAAPADAVTPAAESAATADPFAAVTTALQPSGLSSQDWAIGLGVMAVTGVVWFFVRGAVQAMLAKNRAAPDAAVGASWALFAALMSLTATVVFGLLGNFFRALTFLIPSLSLSLVLLLIAAFMIKGALGRRR